MRRPRSRLQVSTFPFLAVLLCAMGALLLLLFIMDRRAKIAAQHTAAEVVAERKKRTQEEEDARQAEWQKAKDLLHQSLAEQFGQVSGDATGMQQKADDAARNVARLQGQHGDLTSKVKDESVKLALLRTQIDAQRADLKHAQSQETKSKAELLEAARELAELERAFLQLKGLKESENKVHSVVPYRGKHGDERKPIYVECFSAGVLFHPEKKSLVRLDFTPDSFKTEIERRAGPLAIQKPVKDKGQQASEEKKGPYVLYLVRPEGIKTYYSAQAALRGYQLDFGYELVDEDWVLDFNVDPNARPTPIAVAKNVLTPKREIPPLPLLMDRGPIPGGTNAGIVPGLPTAPSGITQNIPPLPVMERNPGQGGAHSGLAPILPAAPSGVTQNIPPLPAMERNPGQGASILPPPSNPGGGSRGPAFVPIGKLAPPVPIASSNPGSAELAPPSIPVPGSNVAPRSPEGSPTPGEPGKKSMPSFGTEEGKKTPPPVKLVGNRDFIITIDCHADHATLFPIGLQFRWNTGNAAATDQALVKAVTNLIERRQASVREGEPPYRPVLRFQVSADGRATYLRAYPLLEPLGVAMTRENVVD